MTEIEKILLASVFEKWKHTHGWLITAKYWKQRYAAAQRGENPDEVTDLYLEFEFLNYLRSMK